MPNDNSLIHNNFIYSAGSGDKEKLIVSSNASYHTNISDPANSFFIRDVSWEYFSNELEFE